MPTYLTLFQDQQIRRHRDEIAEKRYFSVVDIISIASGSTDGRKYRNKLKQRLTAEGSEVVTNCHQLKMPAPDGKMRLTDAAKEASKTGGTIAKQARKQLESKTGKSVITGQNFLPPK